MTETSVAPSSVGGIDHTGVPATDPSSARTDATTAETGCAKESGAVVMTPSQRTTTDTHRPTREHLWTMPSGGRL